SFFFSSRRRHTRLVSDWSSDVCSSDLLRAGRPEADLLFTLPKRGGWDLGVLTRYIRHTYPPVQLDMLIGSVRRRGGAWGAIALRSGRASCRGRGEIGGVGVVVKKKGRG